MTGTRCHPRVWTALPATSWPRCVVLLPANSELVVHSSCYVHAHPHLPTLARHFHCPQLASYAQPKGVGSYLRTHLGNHISYDNTKVQRELGLKFTSLRDSFTTLVPDLVKWEHLKSRESKKK